MNSQNIQVVALIRAVLLPKWNLSVIVALSRIKDHHSKTLIWVERTQYTAYVLSRIGLF